MPDVRTPAADAPSVGLAACAIHPLWLRLTHWTNALAVLVMVNSG
jgi:hypothetical protein